tara:strand:+ start:1856 stop:2203 length:348 start_codon:yes stop_codon:yes gene_type:complete
MSGSTKTSAEKENEKSTEVFSGTKTTQLELDQDATDKIIADVLGGANGLKDIFSGEQNAGIFDSSVAAQASGDLTANLIGELAKLTGKTVEESESEAEKRRKKETLAAEAEFKFG